MLRAIVASEDARFYEHHGVDAKGVVRAFVANHQAGGVSQGASTLTMQYVRNVQRDSARRRNEVIDATQQTAVRKLQRDAAGRRGGEGADQGADPRALPECRVLRPPRLRDLRRRRGLLLQEPAKDLTLAEAATLAGLVKAPSSYDPAGSNQHAALDRRNYVIDRMADLEYVAPALAAKTKKPADRRCS